MHWHGSYIHCRQGGHAYNVFAHAIENCAFFVIRVTRYLTRNLSKKRYLHPELADQYRYICKEVAFDYLPAQGYGEYEISLSVLRFPIGNGTYKNIITNLPENEFLAEEIKEIYRLRWASKLHSKH